MDKGGKNMDRKLNLKEQAGEILKIALAFIPFL